jgi:uncharacterized protein YjbI with pentapeptide repeats
MHQRGAALSAQAIRRILLADDHASRRPLTRAGSCELDTESRGEMANPEHVTLLKKGAKTWNAQRPADPDLSGSRLEGASLTGADLRQADFSGAMLRRANFWRCDLKGARFDRAMLYKTDLAGIRARGASFARADLYRANFTAAGLLEADFSGARLKEASFVAANLTRATFANADLSEASLVRSKVEGANFVGARIYGLAVWDIHGEPANQEDLIISRDRDSPVRLDNLKLAQFVYLLLDNAQVREAIDTLTSKVVLILGRFSAERKPTLDAMRVHLRTLGLLPVLFDFAIPSSRDVTETVRILAGMARFVIADVTDATEVRAELHYVVPAFPSLPVQPIIAAGAKEFISLGGNLAQYPWVLPTFAYSDTDHLLESLPEHVLAPAMNYRRANTDRGGDPPRL